MTVFFVYVVGKACPERKPELPQYRERERRGTRQQGEITRKRETKETRKEKERRERLLILGGLEEC